MKKYLISIVIMTFFVIYPELYVFAPPPPVPVSTPVDNHVSLLLLAGVLFGSYSLFRNRKTN